MEGHGGGSSSSSSGRGGDEEAAFWAKMDHLEQQDREQYHKVMMIMVL